MSYEFKTTFWTDFTIADAFGDAAIKDTFRRAFKEWKTDVTYCAELALVLNWKCWAWNEKNDVRMEIYREFFYKVRDYGYRHFKGEDLQYFWRTLD